MKQAFVIMPFDSEYWDLYTRVLWPVFHNRSVALKTLPDLDETGTIPDILMNAVTTSQIFVANLSNNNPNVLYELGLVHRNQASIKKTILIKERGTPDLPSDIRSYMYIEYYKQEGSFNMTNEKKEEFKRQNKIFIPHPYAYGYGNTVMSLSHKLNNVLDKLIK